MGNLAIPANSTERVDRTYSSKIWQRLFIWDFIVMNLMNFANDDVNGPYQYSMDKNDGF